MATSGHQTRAVFGPFYRKLGGANQDAEIVIKQLLSGELWGGPGRYGLEPAAKAHRGPLPDDAEGFEFWAFQQPDNRDGARVFWRIPGEFLAADGNAERVTLKIAFVKLTQSLHQFAP